MHNNFLDGEKSTQTFFGFYRGIVVDNKDPLESGRIQIKIYPMFKHVGDKDLPWAIKADSGYGGTANVGSSVVPEIDSHVFCFFENGDHRFPVYFAGAPAIQNGVPDIPTLSREDDGTVTAINAAKSSGVPTATGGSWDEPSSAYAPVYPNNKVYRSAQGVVIEIDDTEGATRLHVYHPSGTRSEIDNEGNSVEHVSAKKTTVIVSDNNIEVKGNQDTTVSGSYGVKIGSDGTIDATGKCTINTGSDTIINAAAKTTITAGGDVTVSSGGNVTVSGGVILLN